MATNEKRHITTTCRISTPNKLHPSQWIVLVKPLWEALQCTGRRNCFQRTDLRRKIPDRLALWNWTGQGFPNHAFAFFIFNLCIILAELCLTVCTVYTLQNEMTIDLFLPDRKYSEVIHSFICPLFEQQCSGNIPPNLST